jgi:hypothetical protein
MRHEYFRGPQWTDPDAFGYWAPRIKAAKEAWTEFEALSVSTGLRDSALFSLTIPELVEATNALATQELELTVLSEQAMGQGYSNAAALIGAPGVRVAIHRPGLRIDWLKAWALQDDDMIGQLLGFPPCCIKFFKKVWKEEQRRDTTLSMAHGDEAPIGCNILLRWIGVRLVTHLPCSFNCQKTEAIAAANAELMKEGGLSEPLQAIIELLSLPMKYEAKNGVGIVSTDFFRFGFSTDPVDGVIERDGVTPEIPKVKVTLAIPHEDNSFASKEAMRLAHEPIIEVVRAEGPFESIADPGCGDGTLLNKLFITGLAKHCWGCDVKEDVIERGRTRHPDIKLEARKLEDGMWPYTDAILFMPGRLSEIKEADDVRQRIAFAQGQGAKIIVYAYTDNLPPEGLESLCKNLSLPGLEDGTLRANESCSAAVLSRIEL